MKTLVETINEKITEILKDNAELNQMVEKNDNPVSGMRAIALAGIRSNNEKINLLKSLMTSEKKFLVVTNMPVMYSEDPKVQFMSFSELYQDLLSIKNDIEPDDYDDMDSFEQDNLKFQSFIDSLTENTVDASFSFEHHDLIVIHKEF